MAAICHQAGGVLNPFRMRNLTGAEEYLAEQAMPHLPREEAYEKMGYFLDAVDL